MPTSEARIKANKANSAKSTGPRTTLGKEQSRRNGLKHGMAGQGIVLPEADLAEVDARDAALQAELAPKSVMGAILVRQMATLSVRMERGARQEFAAVANRVRHATDDFDAERVLRAEELLEAIGEDPRKTVRQLRKSPEGIELMLETWQDLRDGLTRESRPFWSPARLETMANLLGLRDNEVIGTRIGLLTRATRGDFLELSDSESDGGGLDREARQAWARGQLVERIDEEIANLEGHFVDLDVEKIEQDRAEAGDRALFDPSREASLARRYESEARRGFFRSLKEFRQVEAEAAERAESEAPPASASPEEVCAPLASCRETTSPAPYEETPGAVWPVSVDVSSASEVDRGAVGRSSTGKRPTLVPA